VRTAAKRRARDRRAELEAELLGLQALDELALYDARHELDRYYAELLGELEAELAPGPWWDVVR
jgi:hypothetical protein